MTPKPGSDEAIKQGCTCAVMDNAHGAGIPGTEHLDGGPYFWYDESCPLHHGAANALEQKGK